MSIIKLGLAIIAVHELKTFNIYRYIVLTVRGSNSGDIGKLHCDLEIIIILRKCGDDCSNMSRLAFPKYVVDLVGWLFWV